MRAVKVLFVCGVLPAVLLPGGCRTACDPQAVLQTVVFPYEWVGDIDETGFNEPSGLCWHAQRRTLFVAGDEGDLCEMATDGTMLHQRRIRPGDFEGVTYDPATGLLYVAVEEEELILELDPDTLKILREFQLPREFGGRTLMAAGGEGIEAITFIPDPTHAEGGVFYIANQAFTLSDPRDISAIFQVELPLRTRSGPARITGYFAPGVIDLSGLHYDREGGQLLAVSDAANLILTYSPAHELLSVQAFPGDNQEGVAVDDEGFIYIAQDTGGILKLKWVR